MKNKKLIKRLSVVFNDDDVCMLVDKLCSLAEILDDQEQLVFEDELSEDIAVIQCLVDAIVYKYNIGKKVKKYRERVILDAISAYVHTDGKKGIAHNFDDDVIEKFRVDAWDDKCCHNCHRGKHSDSGDFDNFDDEPDDEFNDEFVDEFDDEPDDEFDGQLADEFNEEPADGFGEFADDESDDELDDEFCGFDEFTDKPAEFGDEGEEPDDSDDSDNMIENLFKIDEENE